MKESERGMKESERHASEESERHASLKSLRAMPQSHATMIGAPTFLHVLAKLLSCARDREWWWHTARTC